MANHLTPTELADEVNMKRREVISKCMEMGVPIFNGRIDKSLFVASLEATSQDAKQRQGSRLAKPHREVSPRSARALYRLGHGISHGLPRLRRRRLEDDRRPPAQGGRQVRLKARRHVQGRLGPLGHEELRRGRRDRQAARARADGARNREGRQGLDPRQHAARVDLLRLRGAHRRRHRRSDLPDELAGGVRVRARELGRSRRDRRGRGAAREDQGRARPLPAARARDPHDRQGRRGDLRRRADRARRRALGLRLAGALRVGDARRHLHVHLHVGHDGAAQGLRDLPRQLPRDARHGRGEERPRRRRGAHLSLPAARPLVRAPDPVRQLRARLVDRLLGARSPEDRAQPLRGQADLLPVGAADLREDLHDRDGRDREGGRRQEEDLRLVDRRRQALPRGRALGRRRRCALSPVQARRPPGAPQDPQPLRRQPARRRHRRGADQSRHPALLRRRGRPGPRGLGHDRDVDGGHDRHARTTSSSARSESRCRASR